MRLLALAFLFCLHSVANAQQFQLRKVMICDKAEVVFTTILNEFHEVPQWTGTGTGVNDESIYVLTVNKDDSSWTLVQVVNEIACVVGVGKGSRPMFGNPV